MSTESSQAPLALAGVEWLGEVGSGAKSGVWRARKGDRELAIKVLRGSGATDEVERFRREATGWARARHPRLAPLLHVGVVDGRPFAAMDWVQGRPLSTELQGIPLTKERLVALARDVASALAALHARGLVHGDVRPRNILLTALSRACLVDPQLPLGLWRPGDEDGRPYRAPETDSGECTARTDLYGLGAVLMHALVGHPPSAEPARTVAALQNPRYPADLCELVSALVHPDPRHRLGSAEQLVRELGALSGSRRDRHAAALPTRVPVDETPLFGRGAELDLLMSEWDAVLRGQGRIALVTGPAGVGKSRLGREILSEARADGAVVLVAESDEGDPLPFSALRHALEVHAAEVRALPEGEQALHRWRLAQAAGDNGRHLTQLVPALGPLLGARPSYLVGGDGHDALQDAMASFLLGLASSGPVALYVDDVQWLDDASLQVLSMLAAGAGQAHLLLVLSGRSDAPSVERARTDLAERFSLVHEVAPLDGASLQELVGALLGGAPVQAAAVEAIATRSAGNPFAVREYVEAMVDAGSLRPVWGTWTVDGEDLAKLALPTDVLELVLRRIDGLGEIARAVLSAGAVLGGRFAVDLLPAVCGQSEDDVATALVEARRARLVESVGEDELGFVHDRVRESLLVELGAASRRQLHQRAAEALDARGDDGPAHIYAVAHHYAQGEVDDNAPRVYATNLEAGLRAMDEYAAEQAWTLLSSAAAAAAQGGFAVDSRLGHSLGITSAHTGRFRLAVEQLEAHLQASTDPLEQVQLHVALADLRVWGFIDTEGAWRDITAAFEVLGAPWPRSLLQRLTSGLGALFGALWVGWRGGEPYAGEELARQRLLSRLYVLASGVAYFDMDDVRFLETAARQMRSGPRLPPSKEVVDGHLAVSMMWAVLGFRGAAERGMERARELAEAARDRWSLAAAHLYRGFALHQLGDSTGAEVIVRDTLVQHDPWLETVDYLVGSADLTWNLLVRGRALEARAWVERAEARASRWSRDVDLLRAHTVFLYAATVQARLGAGEQARAAIDAGRQALQTHGSSRYTVAELAAHHMGVCLELADLDGLDQAIAAWEALNLRPGSVAFQLRIAYLFRAYGRLEQHTRARSDRLIERERQLVAAVRDLGKAAATDVLTAHHAVLAAALERIGGRLDQAHAKLDEALVIAEASDAPWVRCEALVQRALLLRIERDGDGAERCLAEARDLARAGQWVARLERLRGHMNG